MAKFRTPTRTGAAEPELLAYVREQLASVEVNNQTNDQLRQRSSSLVTQETKFRLSRAKSMANLGFDVPASYGRK
jgi:hypothetical protein